MRQDLLSFTTRCKYICCFVCSSPTQTRERRLYKRRVTTRVWVSHAGVAEAVGEWVIGAAGQAMAKTAIGAKTLGLKTLLCVSHLDPAAGRHALSLP
jgi:hypothetical protein